MNWKSTAAVSGVGLIATWLGWTPSPRFSATDAPAAPIQAVAVESLDIQEQAARLQTRVRSELDYSIPRRNPFRFTVRPVPAERTPPPTQVSPAPTMPELLPFRLSGMATDIVDGQPQRTAILTTATDVVFAREGEHIGTYVVSGIDEMGVDVTGADGTVRRLPLTP